MKGDIFFHPSTSIGRSSRGNETFAVFSAASGFPPVMLATRAGSMGAAGGAAGGADAAGGAGATVDGTTAEGGLLGPTGVCIGGGDAAGGVVSAQPKAEPINVTIASTAWRAFMRHPLEVLLNRIAV
jgi:hypothetical protein